MNLEAQPGPAVQRLEFQHYVARRGLPQYVCLLLVNGESHGSVSPRPYRHVLDAGWTAPRARLIAQSSCPYGGTMHTGAPVRVSSVTTKSALMKIPVKHI